MSKTMNKSMSKRTAIENILNDTLITKDNCQIIHVKDIRIGRFGEQFVIVLPSQEFLVDEHQKFRWYRNSTDKEALTVAMITTCIEGPECLISPFGANFVLLVDNMELAQYLLTLLASALSDEIWDGIEKANLVIAKEIRKTHHSSLEELKELKEEAIDRFNQFAEKADKSADKSANKSEEKSNEDQH